MRVLVLLCLCALLVAAAAGRARSQTDLVAELRKAAERCRMNGMEMIIGWQATVTCRTELRSAGRPMTTMATLECVKDKLPTMRKKIHCVYARLRNAQVI